MALMQIRNMPDDLKERLRARAEKADITMSDYVIRLVRDDLDKPTMEEWLERVRALPLRTDLNLTAAEALAEARSEQGLDTE
jgi:plasmid stability protein